MDALIIIDYCFAGFVGGDGAQFAGTFAGPRNFNDRAIRARSFAQTAFDAFRFINEGTVGDNRNRFFGTAGNAAMGQTVATGVGHDETVQRTLVAGDRQYLNNRRRGDIAVQGGRCRFGNRRIHRLAERRLDPVLQHGPFFVDAAAITRSFVGDDRLQNVFHIGLQTTLKGHLGDFGQDLAADFGNLVDFRHCLSFPPIMLDSPAVFPAGGPEWRC